MGDKIHAGDRVTYIPEGESVASARSGIAQTDGKSNGSIIDEHTIAKVSDSKTGQDVGNRVVWKK